MDTIPKTKLFIGTDFDCKNAGKDFYIIHACKTCHQKALDYTGNLNKKHSNYLIYETPKNLYLNLVDMKQEWQPQFAEHLLTKSLEFINKNITNNILVHCNKGISRSPSIVLLYLATKNLIDNSSYNGAKEDFTNLYPYYNPTEGVRIYLTNNWQNLLNKYS